jgi:hypothetical protein
MYLHLLNAVTVLVIGGVQTFTTKHKVWVHCKADSGTVITHYLCFCYLYTSFLWCNHPIFQGEIQEKARVLHSVKVNDVSN